MAASSPGLVPPGGRIPATPGGVVDGTAPRRRGRPRRIPVGANCANPRVQSAPPIDTVNPVNPCCLKNNGYSENYANFLKSSLPQQVLVFAINEWVEFPERVRNVLIQGFRDGKSANIVVISGTRYLVDFINMVLISLESRIQKSIAWIDGANNCFFPKFVIDGGDAARIGMEVIISKYGCSSNILIPGDENDFPMANNEPMAGNGGPSQHVPMMFYFDPLITQRLEVVDKSSEYYFDVENSFLSGLGKFVDPGFILGVYNYKPVGCPALAQNLAFHQQVKYTRKLRGHSNVRRAWFGGSKQVVANIILHGFGACMSSVEGVHLSSEGCSYLSAKNCGVDENGIQHILLCKVIMGRMEKIKPGSDQWHPSSDAFDSGVDNPLNPKTYVIWGSYINLHIQPECVVSFHLPPTSGDHLAGLNTNDGMDGTLLFTHQAYVWIDYLVHILQLPPEEMPLLPQISIFKLFAIARGTISPVGRDILDNQFHDFRCKIIDEKRMLRKMKETVGDQVLTLLKKMENMQ